MEINKIKCSRCGICADVCLKNLINVESAYIDTEHCNECSQCISICPCGAITHEGILPPSIEKSSISFDSIRGLIRIRRTHRSFTDKDIPDDLICSIAEAVRFSPTGTNAQNVCITVVAGRKRMKELTDIVVAVFKRLVFIIGNPFVFPLVRVALGKKMSGKLKGYAAFLSQYPEKDILGWNAPVLFVFHAKKKGATPEQDCSIWSSAAVLLAETMGLGTCFNGFFVIGINRSEKAKRLIQLPKGHKVYSTFLAGYPKHHFVRESVRKEAQLNIIR